MHLGQAKSGLRQRVIKSRKRWVTQQVYFRFHRADTPYKQCHQKGLNNTSQPASVC